MLYSSQPSAPSVGSASASSSFSSASQSSRELLFGEIESITTNTSQSLRSNISHCNLTLSSNQTFLKFWLCDNARDTFLSYVDAKDLSSLRLVGHDFSNRAAPFLFTKIRSTFKTSTFGKPARLAALERIGHHVQDFSLNLPLTQDMFLPPLINQYGEEQSFIYTPQVHLQPTQAGKIKESKFGSWEIVDLLVKQYPPLFHAATNVPNFIRAFSSMPNLQHLRIDCPSQDFSQNHCRSIVDYALISLRIAIENTPLYFLDTLTFEHIHPAGLLYLQPMLGFGASPRSAKRWSQISTIFMQMHGNPSPHLDQLDDLKILHKYLYNFSSSLSHFTFRWIGAKGPCPLSLDSEPCFKKSGTSTSQIPTDRPRTLQFPNLRYMELENAIMDARQISSFIERQRRTLTEFKFESIALRTGDWDEALSPLSKITRSEAWKQKQTEVMDVPLILSTIGLDESMFLEPEPKPARASGGLGRWLSRARSIKVPTEAKEQSPKPNAAGRVKRLLKSSMFSWR